jgi:nitrite reductase/ring-hydroxylating ferredoxin subunit/uncharacterized membrane protein
MMENINALTRVIDNPAVEEIADPLSRAIRGAYEAAGPVGRQTKNALHGVWLGHPLHPVFTDLPIGAWTTALALDTTAQGDSGKLRAATFAMGVGLAGAIGAAVTGLTDWSETDGESRRAGLIHGLLNVTATALMATSFALRRHDSHDGGRKCAWAGYAIAVGAAYLGGDLVYGQRLGVTHAAVGPLREFTRVIDSGALAEGTMMRVQAADDAVLLVRQHGRVCALAHSCSHLGGPLSEGTLKEGSVICPWHGSEFSLDDGRVLNGPATQPQPCFVARERDGYVEIKLSGGSFDHA